MSQKKILVPVGPSGKNLKSVRYAMALAQRFEASIYILQLLSASKIFKSDSISLENTLKEVVNSARQVGLTVYHLVAQQEFQEFKDEIVDLINRESIDVLVFGADDEQCERLLKKIRPLVSSQIIEVKEKDHVDGL